jgi:anaerobic selenocysteine-containing dehydrogenase
MSQNSNFHRGMSRRDFLKIAGITGAAGALGTLVAHFYRDVRQRI